ncbi:hypothetical protein BE221DRAFT_64698 [Ostreococcus tauri]|uniref:Uncharacterized protein n=1 Tax=Ostreococcus tauri TaxID=70448 RepID=A0A1Y5HX60_OSTTA|nr:hypothetical protein BE221DRAFT_64698 [Ostreococcus tauri]
MWTGHGQNATPSTLNNTFRFHTFTGGNCLLKSCCTTCRTDAQMAMGMIAHSAAYQPKAKTRNSCLRSRLSVSQ